MARPNRSFSSAQLGLFAEVYRNRSYTAAATSTFMSYQGVRKSMRKLESELGSPLFTSEDGTLTPTYQANCLYNLAMKWERDLENLDAVLETDKGESREQIVMRVCSTIGVSSYLGYDYIGEFTSEYPNLLLHMDEFTNGEADEQLGLGNYSIAILASPFSSDIIAKPLLRDRSGAWVNRSNPLAEKQSLLLSDLEGQNVIAPAASDKAGQFYRRRIQEDRIEPNSLISCIDFGLPYHYALQNYGIGLTQESARSYLHNADDDVVYLPLLDGYDRTIAFCRRREYRLNKREKIVCDYFSRRMKLDGAES